MEHLHEVRIAVLGLGYVGLPLAVEFGKRYPTIGFDVNPVRVDELTQGLDNTREVSREQLSESDQLQFSTDTEALRKANVYIVTVPTPIDLDKKPDLTPLKSASALIAQVIEKGDVVIYESTVYPGATEEDCIPVIEQATGFKLNRDFYAGYSPERVNPGDKTRTVANIKKVTSGSTPAAAEFVDSLYRSIIKAGTHKASSIKVAEASKVIENTQRDLNIALINELAIIFNKLGIDTEEVLKAAGTKWNFLPFRPGLVGGHCISVDPYYLTHKAEAVGYHPDIILAGRLINDGMGAYVCDQLVKKMVMEKLHVRDANILIMGLAFKENCPDIRNTRVVDIIGNLSEYGAQVDVYDPWVDADSAEKHYGIRPLSQPQVNHYDAVIVAVAHDHFRDIGINGMHAYCKPKHVIYDLKYMLNQADSDLRL
ncbi:Vi polysaccharide biosynthesis UDP-N-acetylglucosamine C-6 dehydrogenase TviB [Paraferrimonas sedimenticola]|uniref:UDP-N-acetyl-d-glucosamine 6-dehydrogenase WbpA n=1 Tax=Paraferrimonas sedimenticola TaxID=375674 RepID=A0AA37RW41_9GAMM|nr:Vi polysaccharide biosynthesis UDP-N-acetylglucosamine C-6 dehydrogenase TviB [Paraferrimonas sedimenticola]GLP96029.1 UDP-N-acetyl-d-glucosamine 6-dehydrogenase WbpA [Paraferrimonas sedimenticola]